jgi:hypothetical protein
MNVFEYKDDHQQKMVHVIRGNFGYSTEGIHFLYLHIILIRDLGYTGEVGFEVLTAVSTKMAVFWVVALCSLAEVYQRFRGPYCLHHQGSDQPDDGGSKDL